VSFVPFAVKFLSHFATGIPISKGKDCALKKELYTDRSFSYFREGNQKRIDFSLLSWEDLDKAGYILAGSPDTVAR